MRKTWLALVMLMVISLLVFPALGSKPEAAKEEFFTIYSEVHNVESKSFIHSGE